MRLQHVFYYFVFIFQYGKIVISSLTYVHVLPPTGSACVRALPQGWMG